ncbi:hypothetical protein Nepgr_007310 [Nepenthes gracilis]|uniref:Uncharacterized protein n=1 Tax=Nepenthes gracilis TaxID=150966 RepID=A0AAD3S6Q4_NEPGR|nr:hypothetical protein Nepgr_007310 [Nepenthes gracilis]
MATRRSVYILLFPTILSLLISLCYEVTAEQPQIPTQTTGSSNSNRLICGIEETKIKIARLESILEETDQQLHAKSLYLEKCEKKIEEMTRKIHDLQAVLSNIKAAMVEDERVSALEDEVRVLWAASRKNNFDLGVLESKTEVAEKQLKVVASQVEKMAYIVTELWIQIQRLEQALQITEKRTIEFQRQRRHARCMFFKFVSKIWGGQHLNLMGTFDSYLYGRGSIWRFHVSKAWNQLEWFFTTIKKYHHHLQGLVKQEMEIYEFTATLANEEVVFFVASALVVIPLMGAWVFLSSHWSY